MTELHQYANWGMAVSFLCIALALAWRTFTRYAGISWLSGLFSATFASCAATHAIMAAGLRGRLVDVVMWASVTIAIAACMSFILAMTLSPEEGAQSIGLPK